MKLINSIENTELEWLKDGFTIECNKKNLNVLLFKHGSIIVIFVNTID